MTESEWNVSSSILDLLGYIRIGSGRAKLRNMMSKQQCNRKLLLFMIACCKRASGLLTDARSFHAISVSEQLADGGMLKAETVAAQTDAENAYRSLRSGTSAPAFTAACSVMELSRFTGKQAFSHAIYVADLAAQACSLRPNNQELSPHFSIDRTAYASEQAFQSVVLRDVFRSPFHSHPAVVSWKSSRAISIAEAMYRDDDFSTMPILADAIENADCADDVVLSHCRSTLHHSRGCWVVDLILGK